MVTTACFARHGQSTYNLQKIVQAQIREGTNPLGLPEPRLTLQGYADATTLAQALEDTPLDVIYTSPLRRAVETASVVAGHQKKPFITGENFFEDNRLMERNMFHPGMTVEEINAQMGRDYATLKTYGEAPDTGEPESELTARFSDFMQEVIPANPDKRILILTHGGLLRIALAKNYLKRDMIKFEVSSLSTLNFEDSTLKNYILNDTSHLKRNISPEDDV